MSAVDELRSVRTQIRILQDEVTRLNESIKNHPAKPQHFEQTIEIMALWDQAKKPFETRRREIVEEMKPLNERKIQLQKELNQAPVSRITLAMMIDRLADLEATFANAGHAEAWDQLTRLIDFFEYEEARMAVESQVHRLEAA